jgi:hypothetical protein
MKTPEKHHRRRLVTAPPPSHPDLHTKVLNVECADDEDVEWLWTETPASSPAINSSSPMPRPRGIGFTAKL